MMRKAQMEIMGIAIVVMLIAVGLVFYLSFSLKPKDTSVKTTYIQSTIAANTLNALLQVSTKCGKNMMGVLIEGTKNPSAVCKVDTVGTTKNQLNDIAKPAIMTILDSSIKARNLDYEFTSQVVSSKTPELFISSKTGASGAYVQVCTRSRETETQPLGLVRVSLSVCNNG